MKEVCFFCQGKRLVGTLYAPRSRALINASGAPVVVMGHGLSLTRDCGLERYALRFAEAGMVVLTFDYRGFGQSDGEPRELVSASQQVADYHAALRFVRALPEVDAARCAAWGTSYSGGIALQCAYEDARLEALVLLVPNLDSAATAAFVAARVLKTAPWLSLRLLSRALLDVGAGLLGRPPVYAQAMGRVGEWAAYVNDESFALMSQIRGPAWKNRIALRELVRSPLFRPLRHAADLRCPMFIVAADADDLTPVAPLLEAARLAGAGAELHRYPGGHFGMYTGALFEEVAAKQTDFLVRQFADGSSPPS
ncbi:MAG: alpha/beta hydrolase [Myxococcaceae bacterium]|nr:alpha/beta hydrolase [Myxococcaceae bacterium]